ncbi:phage holin family protein [Thermoactinospora rubra]|uniref:phage holin family protein n=1 Tax=Thermoactinospora rubra TaxID=1088767 RepID=UPI00117C0C79|nr:phage holin family protein [Thermoactinospora rubra]
MTIILKVLAAAVAFWVATQLVPGVEVQGNPSNPTYWGTLVVVALIFGVINAVVKPIVKTLGCAFIVLTLGLFLIVINAAMLLLTSWISGQLDVPFHVDNFWPAAVLGSIVISVVTWLLGLIIPD